MLGIGRGTQLALGLVGGVLRHRSVVRIKVQEGELVGEEFLDPGHNFPVVGKVEGGGLVADVDAPYRRMVLESCRGGLVLGDGVGLREFPGIVAVSAPPAGHYAADDGSDSVLAEQVEGGTVVVHADDEVDSAVGQVLDVGLRAGIGPRVVHSDIEPAAVHPSGLGDVTLPLVLGEEASCRGRSRRQQYQSYKNMLFHDTWNFFCCLLSGACCLVLAVWRLLSGACCLVPAACCVMPGASGQATELRSGLPGRRTRCT